MALIHGGQLNEVAEHYKIPLAQWLDLSTGIAPFSYPVGSLPQSIWQHLPQADKALLNAASDYYFSAFSSMLLPTAEQIERHILATSGSQSVIQALPHLLSRQSLARQVFVPDSGYKEHQQAWQQAGFDIVHYAHDIDLAILQQVISDNAVVVVINPNNPTGQLYSKTEITNLLTVVNNKSGLLIVDEAFIDVIAPAASMIDLVMQPEYNDSLLVLRSVGKFFGLAGIRLGFVMANVNWIALLQSHFGPWQVNGAAQYIGKKALIDKLWQQSQRQQLQVQCLQLKKLLKASFLQDSVGCDLFQTVFIDNAQTVYHQLCQQAVYVRLLDDKSGLRFGVPDEAQMQQLALILKAL